MKRLCPIIEAENIPCDFKQRSDGVALFGEDVIPAFKGVKLAIERDCQSWILVWYRNGHWYSCGRRVRIRWWINLFCPYELPACRGLTISKREFEEVRQDISRAFAGYNKFLVNDPVQLRVRKRKAKPGTAAKQEPSDNTSSPQGQRVRRPRAQPAP